ncbi:hypothetical protein [Halarchaeum acidiphilum]|uniref:hypothetical protein n=1 Tax=Halarchaeum acidiphilum TaxID=489138 RepID=UPI0019000EF3|nr:hypothetical protein [Halarchaeum acidiphilum]
MIARRVPESARGSLCALAVACGIAALVLGYALAGFGVALGVGLTAYGSVPTRVSVPVVALGCALLALAYGCWRAFVLLLE